jgi:hypothetical protein
MPKGPVLPREVGSTRLAADDTPEAMAQHRDSR